MDSKPLVKQRKLLLEFIDTYRQLACLWDRQHPGYSVRGARQAAYYRLLRQYRIFDPCATLLSVKNRLDIIRCGFIRELKKVRLSKDMSSDPAMHYKPSLWYYDSCSFLEGQYLPAKETRVSSTDKSHFVHVKGSDQSDEYDDTITEYLEESSNSSIDQDEIPVKRRRDSTSKEPDEAPTVYTEADLECIGRSISLQLRDLDSYQSAIAHKLISETIFYAKIGKLTVDSQVALNVREDNDYILKETRSEP